MSRIFVFGSNTRGVHGAGAADYAVRHHGAVCGQGEGLQGQSYAIPTKDRYIKTLPLTSIRTYVDRFCEFAAANPDMEFDVTRIGCGLAGYVDQDIAPMFIQAPPNCWFSASWRPWLGPARSYNDFT